MTSVRPYLYLRGLRQVDHTVFSIVKGQKTYRDPATRREMPFSSGQQVKRSLLDMLTDLLNEGRSPVTFVWEMPNGALEQREPWSPCDPTYTDQLIGGWMRAAKGTSAVKRRSPLSVSAMRPLHPALVSLNHEAATFDRSDAPEKHNVVLFDDKGNQVSHDEMMQIFKDKQRSTGMMRKWIPEDQVGGRATGLFVYDVAVDLRMLFSVSLNEYEPELDEDIKTKLRDAGWQKTAGKTRLVCPKEKRNQIIPALAESLVNWRVTSNQSRTYSPQNTLAVAISDNANKIGAAIRADLTEQEAEKPKTEPVLDENISGVELFAALPAQGYVRGVTASADALEQAEKRIAERLRAFDYDGQ